MNTIKFRQMIMSWIDLESYNGQANTVKNLLKVFESEKAWHLERETIYSKVLADWLAGLPSSMNTPYMNGDIEKLASQIGIQDAEYFVDNFFRIVAGELIKMKYSKLGKGKMV